MTGGWDLDDVKAKLEEAGADLHPDATMRLMPRPAPGDSVGIIALERVEDVDGPPVYCIHGFASCVSCEKLCYLGDETHKVVADEKNNVYPVCLPCAKKIVPEDQLDEKRLKRIFDRLR